MSLLVKELDTLRRLYEPDGKTPEMLAPVKEGQTYYKGDEVTITNGNGDSVQGVVKTLFVAVVPDWETYNKGVAKGQESML